MSYEQSTTISEVAAKHPFPWREQRARTPAGALVRMVDANGVEVGILEMTALCSIVTAQVHQKATGN
jgi:hypothetical protein